MEYLKLSTMEYPLYEGDIRNEHPEILETQTGDAFPLPDGYVKVVHTDPPEATDTHFYEKQPPSFDGVQWVITWKQREVTDEQRRSQSTYGDSEENKKIQANFDYIRLHCQAAPSPYREAWQAYWHELEAYKQSYPRSGRIPPMPKFDSNGNVLTLNNAGSAPNVTG